MRLELLGGELGIARLDASVAVPSWAQAEGFSSVTRTSDELSVVCSATSIPQDVKAERGWRAFRLAGPLDFSLTGVLASIAAPLAVARVSLFAISTYDTDYILVRALQVDEAIRALAAAGHTID